MFVEVLDLGEGVLISSLDVEAPAPGKFIAVREGQ